MADNLIRPNSVHALAVVNPTGIPEEGDTGNPSAHLSLDADGNLRTSAVAVIGGSVEISNDVGNPVPVSGTVTASGTVSSTPNRPSQGAGRTHVNTTISAAATDQTLYTVTGGKTFYLTTLILSAFNSSTAAVGVIILKDGGTGGTAKLSYLMQQAGLGALVATQPLVPGNNTFLEPLQFATDVFMDITSGTVVYSVGIVGYEE